MKHDYLVVLRFSVVRGNLESRIRYQIKGKNIYIERVYIPEFNPACLHQCTAEPGKLYLCREWSGHDHDYEIKRRKNHHIKVIGVRVLREVFLGTQKKIVLAFHVVQTPHNSAKRKQFGFQKNEMQCTIEQEDITRRYFVDSREASQPKEGEYWCCKPMQLVYENESGTFKVIRVEPLTMESSDTLSPSGVSYNELIAAHA